MYSNPHKNLYYKGNQEEMTYQKHNLCINQTNHFNRQNISHYSYCIRQLQDYFPINFLYSRNLDQTLFHGNIMYNLKHYLYILSIWGYIFNILHLIDRSLIHSHNPGLYLNFLLHIWCNYWDLLHIPYKYHYRAGILLISYRNNILLFIKYKITFYN